MTAPKRVPTMYYVATKRLAEAMQTGSKCNKGTVYAVFADAGKAYAFQEERNLRLVTKVIAL